LALLSTLVDADVVWHVPGRHAMAGDIHGRDALLACCSAGPVPDRADRHFSAAAAGPKS
jgi:hypothetical protein